VRAHVGAPTAGYSLRVPDPDGDRRGMALYPLYPTVPKAARIDFVLYESLALFDALRSGAARERQLASQLLSQRLS
jgi:hypothetical protein